MHIISGSSSPQLAANIADSVGVACANADVKYFPNGELLVRLSTELKSDHVVIVQDSATNVNNRLMELLLLADAARRAGAGTVTALIPYLGYSRQERALSERGTIAMELVAKMIEAAGVHKVVTLDLHSPQTASFFNIEVVNLDPVPLFASALKGRQANMVVVSPDAGSVHRVHSLGSALHANVAAINKSRLALGECIMTGIEGEVQGKHCVLLDDIIDSASTVTKAVALLFKEGALSVEVCATHGVFSGESWRSIDSLPIEKVYITNSIAQPNLSSKFNSLSIHGLFANYLKSII